MVVSVQLKLLPASGYVPLFEDPLQSFRTMLMPAAVLGSHLAAVLMRHTRSAMLEALSADYVRTALAKGMPRRRIVLRHALRNALVPVVTLGALEFGQLLGGSVLTEYVFTIPGVGKLLVDSVFNRDYPVVQGVVICSGGIYVALNLIADLAYVLLDPRTRHGATA
jgi:peptide/nickel transport system permease protein